MNVAHSDQRELWVKIKNAMEPLRRLKRVVLGNSFVRVNSTHTGRIDAYRECEKCGLGPSCIYKNNFWT